MAAAHSGGFGAHEHPRRIGPRHGATHGAARVNTPATPARAVSGTIPSAMDPSVTFDRFAAACSGVGVVPAQAEYRKLRRAWSGMSRYYHTLSHLGACLREFDGALA